MLQKHQIVANIQHDSLTYIHDIVADDAYNNTFRLQSNRTISKARRSSSTICIGNNCTNDELKIRIAANTLYKMYSHIHDIIDKNIYND